MSMTKKGKITPPGAIIQEQLKFRNETVEDFAEYMGLSVEEANNLLRGDMKITPEIAEDLEEVIGSNAMFWKMLETNYRYRLRMAERSKW